MRVPPMSRWCLLLLLLFLSDARGEPLPRSIRARGSQPQLRDSLSGTGVLQITSNKVHLLAASPPSAKEKEKEQQRAIVTTIMSFVATAAFAVAVVLPYKGRQATLDFVTGFLVEKSLSVDNLFVFLMLFDYFRVPAEHTDRVLRWGIVSALVLRGFMIALGVAAVQRCRPVLLAFS